MMKNTIGIKAILGLIAGAGLMAAVNTYSEDTVTTVKSLEDYEKLIGVDVTWEMIQREFNSGDVIKVNNGPHIPLYCRPDRPISYPGISKWARGKPYHVYCIYNGTRLRKIFRHYQ